MNELYPIIRRNRRPLVQENSETDPAREDSRPTVITVPVAEPAQPVAVPVEITKPKKSRDDASPN